MYIQSILHLTFKVNALNNVYHKLIQERNEHIGNRQEKNVPGDNVYYHRRYRFESTPDLFMDSDSWKLAMTKLIDL